MSRRRTNPRECDRRVRTIGSGAEPPVRMPCRGLRPVPFSWGGGGVVGASRVCRVRVGGGGLRSSPRPWGGLPPWGSPVCDRVRVCGGGGGGGGRGGGVGGGGGGCRGGGRRGGGGVACVVGAGSGGLVAQFLASLGVAHRCGCRAVARAPRAEPRAPSAGGARLRCVGGRRVSGRRRGPSWPGR